MKWILLSLIAVGSFANASTVHQCSDNRGRAPTLYTVVSVNNAAVVTVTTPGASELGEVAVLGKANEIGRSGVGDFMLTVDTSNRKVDWKKEKNCWKLVGNTQTFVVAGESSSLEIAPVVVFKPNVRCRAPELQRGRFQLTCKQLE